MKFKFERTQGWKQHVPTAGEKRNTKAFFCLEDLQKVRHIKNLRDLFSLTAGQSHLLLKRIHCVEIGERLIVLWVSGT